MDQSGSSRRDKIKSLVRMNQGRRSAPNFLTALTEAFGEAVPYEALVSLSETDRILESFRQGYQAAVSEGAGAYRRFFGVEQEQQVFRMTGRLAVALRPEDVYFMTKMSESCGAVRLPISTLLRHAGPIIRLDGDSLSLISLDYKEGLLVDHTQTMKTKITRSPSGETGGQLRRYLVRQTEPERTAAKPRIRIADVKRRLRRVTQSVGCCRLPATSKGKDPRV